MSWYAIRTGPGAQMPQREYAVEPTTLDKNGRPMGKGYRIVPSLNPRVSAVERALSDAGFAFYMPSEFKVIRNRKKTATYTTRRYPLLPGYVFVHGVEDWLSLTSLPGVSGVVGIDGVPLKVSVHDILALRMIEAASHAEAERQLQRVNNELVSHAKRTASRALQQAKRKLYPGKRVKVLWGPSVGHEAIITGWTDDQKLKAIVDRLDAVETAVIPFDAVRLVA